MQNYSSLLLFSKKLLFLCILFYRALSVSLCWSPIAHMFTYECMHACMHASRSNKRKYVHVFTSFSVQSLGYTCYLRVKQKLIIMETRKKPIYIEGCYNKCSFYKWIKFGKRYWPSIIRNCVITKPYVTCLECLGFGCPHVHGKHEPRAIWWTLLMHLHNAILCLFCFSLVRQLRWTVQMRLCVTLLRQYVQACNMTYVKKSFLIYVVCKQITRTHEFTDGCCV